MAHPRLAAGSLAPDFSATTYQGHRLRLADYRGQRVLLSFFRFASCPFCNLRLAELVRLQPEFAAQGLTVLAVFESPAQSVLQYLERHGASFALIADPKRRLYEKYCVRASWLGLLRGSWHLRSLARALAQGFWPGRIEGEISMLPADFLIASDGRIETAYYGKDIADHLPLQHLQAWLHGAAEQRTERMLAELAGLS